MPVYKQIVKMNYTEAYLPPYVIAQGANYDFISSPPIANRSGCEFLLIHCNFEPLQTFNYVLIIDIRLLTVFIMCNAKL